MRLTKLVLSNVTIEIRNDTVSITPSNSNNTSKLRRDNSKFIDWLGIYFDNPEPINNFIQGR